MKKEHKSPCERVVVVVVCGERGVPKTTKGRESGAVSERESANGRGSSSFDLVAPVLGGFSNRSFVAFDRGNRSIRDAIHAGGHHSFLALPLSKKTRACGFDG